MSAFFLSRMSPTLDLLHYIFKQFVFTQPELWSNQTLLREHLVNEGCPEPEIERVFDWLDAFKHSPKCLKVKPSSHSLRIFSLDERAKLSKGAQGLIWMLEEKNIINPTQREQIIQQAMLFDETKLTRQDIGRIALVALYLCPNAEASFTWLGSHLFDAITTASH